MTSDLKIKTELHSHCQRFIENRLQTIQNTIQEIQEALTYETKSSAGDKHETGRAMLQLEREKAGNQLAEIQKLQETLSKINITKANEKIGLGSVVFTSNSNYFLAISVGELTFENQKFYAISQNTPIGQLLISKKAGDTVSFRDLTFKIVQVI
jgi:transcription elongation GreA/GreB family factor